MVKRAIIVISLVPESKTESNEQISKDIRKTLKCDWLKGIIKVKVEESHHRMPNGKLWVFEKPA